jgi:acetyl-CoA acetyltransferase family protein
VLAGSTDTISRTGNIKLSAKLELASFHSDPIIDSMIDPVSTRRMGELADEFARSHEIDRCRLDLYSFASRENTRKAQAAGLLNSGLVAVPASTLRNPQWSSALCQDQLESRWNSISDLASLESPYGASGRLTRGNTSAFADGAAAVTLTSKSLAHRFGCRILGTVRSAAITAAAPHMMGDAMVRAIQACIAKAGISLAQIDWFELEEAFAVNCVYVIRALGLSIERVNPHGGALALGHPPATSGLRLLISATSALGQKKCAFSLIALVAGGSQAMAMVIEN